MFEALMPELIALGQVIMIDIALAGDNAIVVGMAAASVAPQYRRKVIVWGIGAAVVMRIAFALLTTQLLAIVGLLMVGGLLLLWVCWKLWRDIRSHREQHAGAELAAEGHIPRTGNPVEPKTVGAAIWQVAVADVSMSLDNVLAVAGAAKDHLWVLVIGLFLAVVLMGVAAGYIARLLQRYPWISYVGLAIILYVALDMIWRGGLDVLHAVQGPAPV